MLTIKISELGAINSLADEDILPVVDASDTTTKKVTAAQIRDFLLATLAPGSVVVSGTSFGAAPAVGTSLAYARADHSHGTPPDPMPSHLAALDPHNGYLLANGARALSGTLSAGTNRITGLGAPTVATDATNKAYVDSKVQGLDWQESVKSRTNDPPASPTAMARYLLNTAPTGDWAGHPNEIATWNGVTWGFDVPNDGWATWIEDVDILRVFNGSAWVTFGSTSDHGALSGLLDDDHTQYFLADGTRDLVGALTVDAISAPAVASESTGRIYFDSALNKFRVSQNGGAYVDLVTGGTVTSVVGEAPLSTGGTSAAPTITFPSWPANNAGVLTNNGSGGLSWETPATGTVTGSGTATQIAFFTSGSAIGSETAVGSNSFTWDAAKKWLGIGTSPAHFVDARLDQDAQSMLLVRNSSGGGAARSVVQASSTTSNVGLYALSSGYTDWTNLAVNMPSPNVAGVFFQASGNSFNVIGSQFNGGPIDIVPNTHAGQRVFRVDASGRVIINGTGASTTTNRLDVKDSTGVTSVFTVGDGAVGVVARNASDSTTAFQVQNAAGSSIFSVNSAQRIAGIRTASPEAVLDIQAGSTSSALPALKVTSTSSGDGIVAGISSAVTSGTTGNEDYAIHGSITGAATVAYMSAGVSGINFTTQTIVGQVLANGGGPIGTRGTALGVNNSGHQTGTTDRGNTGVLGYAGNSIVNIGVGGAAATSKDSATNVGVAGTAQNGGGGTAYRIGGLFSISQSSPFSFDPQYNTSAALIADNINTSDPIFLARDNSTTVFTIANEGAVLAKNTSDSTAAFAVQNAAGTTVLDVDTTNQRVGVGTSVPSDKLTVYDATLARVAVTSNADSQIMLESGGGPSAYPAWLSYGHRGTIASPSATQSGDTLGGFFFGGYSGAANTARVTLVSKATENWSASGIGSNLVFSIMPANTATFTSIEAFRLTPPNIGSAVDGEVVVNESGLANLNFRVESDNNANVLFVDAGTDRVGIGTSSPGAVVDIQAGTLLSGVPAQQITATLPNPGGSSYERALEIVATANGSANSTPYGLVSVISGSYTGSGQTSALTFRNDLAGTGSLLFNDGLGMRPDGNRGIVGHGVSVTTGNNSAVVATAGSGNRNFGGYFSANIDKASALNVGVYGAARNAAVGSTEIGGMFHLYSSATFPAFESAALLVDNGSSTSPIFLARDNGTPVFKIDDNGSVTIGQTGTSYTLPTARGTNGQVLQTNGSGAVTWQSLIGLTDGDKGDITVASSGAAWTIDAGAVTNSKLADVATATFKGRATAGTGTPEDLTGTQATALLDTFTSTLKGLAPASGGGTTNFLRADGTWAAPPPALTGSGVDNQIAVWSGASSLDGDGSLTWNGSSLGIAGALNKTGVGSFSLYTETSSDITVANGKLDVAVTLNRLKQYGYAGLELRTDYLIEARADIVLAASSGSDPVSADAMSSNTLTDFTQSWGVNALVGQYIEVALALANDGPPEPSGVVVSGVIASNTATEITVTSPWEDFGPVYTYTIYGAQKRVRNVADPEYPQDVATKHYVDSYLATNVTTTTIATVAASGSIGLDAGTILADASSGLVELILPDATTCAGRMFVIKKIDTTPNKVIVGAYGYNDGDIPDQYIDGSTSYELRNQYEAVKVQSNGTQFWII